MVPEDPNIPITSAQSTVSDHLCVCLNYIHANAFNEMASINKMIIGPNQMKRKRKGFKR